MVTFPHELKFGSLLFYHLRHRGIHIWENRLFIMTAAHSDADLALLTGAFRESLTEMRAGDFLPKLSEPTGGSLANGAATLPTPASSGDPAGPFPLTEAQKEVWLATQMGGEAAVAYNESLSLRFRGSFDLEMFRAAARQVVERHPILLARISADGEQQQVGPEGKVEAPLSDLSGLTEAERDRELAAIIEREARDPFDLTLGPLLRVKVVRLAADHHVVVWTSHHIVCDGWSGGLLVSELAGIYSGLKRGVQPSLEAPASFRDFALQQAAEAASQGVRDDIAYWQRQFADTPPLLELPADHPRARVRSARASTLKRPLDAPLYQAIKRVAAQERTTLVALLMAALKTLLHRLTGQTDLVIGLPVAGQAMVGRNCLVGHCVNLVPVRTRLQAEAGFRENLAAVKKNVLDAYDHQQCTIGSILQHISFPRDPGRPPLVEVIFNVDRDPGAAEFDGVEFSYERNPKRALHFDLFFNFVEGPGGLYLECDYNADLFEASTIERWLSHYQTLLESVAANPGQPLGKLPILTAAGRRQLLREWNHQTRRDYPKDPCVHELFEAQVERTPEAVAVIDGQRRLSYGELNRDADLLAAHLRSLGVGPEVLVGVCVERSAEMIAAMIGILKAGGGYLPLDPNYPKERLAFMLEDTRAPVVLTQRRLAAGLPSIRSTVVCLDEFDWKQPADASNGHGGAGPANPRAWPSSTGARRF